MADDFVADASVAEDADRDIEVFQDCLVAALDNPSNEADAAVIGGIILALVARPADCLNGFQDLRPVNGGNDFVPGVDGSHDNKLLSKFCEHKNKVLETQNLGIVLFNVWNYIGIL